MSKYTTFHIEAERPISESSLEKKKKEGGENRINNFTRSPAVCACPRWSCLLLLTTQSRSCASQKQARL